MYDLIIVGAGPAGASAARYAALRGLSVLVLEREQFPRDKPCGGALSQHVFEYLDFPVPDELVKREFFGGRLVYDDAQTEAGLLYRAGALVLRREFDALLADKAIEAGAEIRFGTKVDAVGDERNSVCVQSGREFFHARTVIISEGASGRLKTVVRPKDKPHQFMFCLCADVPADSAATKPGNPLVLDFGRFRQGYGWIFPRGEDASVGFCEPAALLETPREMLVELLLAHDADMPEKIHGAKIPMGGFKRTTGKGRVLLAGDAAGHADAFLGEGIAWAIRSGQLAAKAVCTSIQNDQIEAMAELFARYCKAELDPELRQTLLLAVGMRYLPRRLVRAMMSDHAALARYISVIAAKSTYREFNKWMFLRLGRWLYRALFK